jgi:hypothetical protein
MRLRAAALILSCDIVNLDPVALSRRLATARVITMDGKDKTT